MGRIADDDFSTDGAPRARWLQFQPGLLASSWTCSGGVLRATMTASGLTNGNWFNSGTGAWLYQLVRGDFDVAAECRVWNAAFDAAPANTAANLVGLAAHDLSRTPTGFGPRGSVLSDELDYEHCMLGFVAGAPDGDLISTEEKGTTASSSAYTRVDAPSAEGYGWLRIRRVGDTITQYDAPASGTPGDGPVPTTWRQLSSRSRPSIRSICGVGPALYSSANTTSLGGEWWRVLNLTRLAA